MIRSLGKLTEVRVIALHAKFVHKYDPFLHGSKLKKLSARQSVVADAWAHINYRFLIQCVNIEFGLLPTPNDMRINGIHFSTKG